MIESEHNTKQAQLIGGYDAQSLLSLSQSLQAKLSLPSWFLSWQTSLLHDFISRGGLPTRKDEGWRDWSLTGLRTQSYKQALPVVDEKIESINSNKLVDAYRITFTNGYLNHGLSDVDDLPEGVSLEPISAALCGKHAGKIRALINKKADQLDAFFKHQPLSALSQALLQDGFCLLIDNDIKLDRPILFHYVTTEHPTDVDANPWQHMFNVVFAAQQSEVTIFEHIDGLSNSSSYMEGITTLIKLDAFAQMTWVTCQQAGSEALHFLSRAIFQEQSSHWRSFSANLGSNRAREQQYFALEGEDATSDCHGCYLTSGEQMLDQQLLTDHRAPNTRSRQFYRGVLNDQSTTIYRGKVMIQKGAQKVDGFQKNNNIVLSDNAKALGRPELEIYADDVKCSHGCTVGALDRQAMFYALSRGIAKEDATLILIQAHCAALLEHPAFEPWALIIMDWLREAALRVVTRST